MASNTSFEFLLKGLIWNILTKIVPYNGTYTTNTALNSTILAVKTGGINNVSIKVHVF